MAAAPPVHRPGPRPHFAWIVLSILFLMLMLNQGDRAFFGNFFKDLQAHLGTNRSALALAVTINAVVSGLAQPVWGRVFERYGSRVVLVSGSLLTAAGFALVPTATAVWQLYLYFGLLCGLGLGGTSPAIGFAIGARWFRDRRAFAFGILAAGGMAGSLIMVPGTMSVRLAFDWPVALLIVAGLSVLVAIPIAAGLLPGSPDDAKTTVPSGRPARPLPAPKVTIGRAIRTWTFWMLAIPSWISGFNGTLIQVHAIPMLTDRGFDPQVSANALGMVSGIGVFAVIGGGLLAARFHERQILAAIYLIRAVGMVLLAYTQNTFMLYLSLTLVGISWGGVQPMVGGLTGDTFGRSALASILSWIFMTQNIIGAAAALLGGAIFDLTGDYFVIVMGTGILLVLGAPMSLAIRRVVDEGGVETGSPLPDVPPSARGVGSRE